GLLPAVEATGRRHSADLQSEERWYHVSVDPADDDRGRPAGAVLIVSDITERKRLEEQGRLAERREVEAVQLRDHIRRVTELERLKTDFLNLASHELRGPLAVLRGYVTMLEDGSLGEPSKAMRAALTVMRGKLREMNGLVTQMLETARLDDSRLVLQLEDLDLRDVLAEARQAIRPLVGSGHRLQVRAGSQPAPIKGDRARLVTIVTSLLDNALKYSPDGGRVTCTLTIRERTARITVSDQGLGILASDVDRLFTRFGRLLDAETRGIPGTGLGLYLAREMARLHGGDVWARPAAGRGSTFTVELPISA
ncbi:MAG: PAS domain S-box protein, partial [Chloroflexi bacterium]